MPNAESTATIVVDTAWMRKQRAYDEYAKGRLSLDETAKNVAEIKPEIKPLSLRRKMAIALVAALTSVLVPAWARRN